MNQCSHAECCEDAYCKGLCKRHYHRIAIAKWRSKNPEKKYPPSKESQRIYDNRYREKHRDEIRNRANSRYWNSVEKNREYSRNWRRRWRFLNPEKARLADRKRSPQALANRRRRISNYTRTNKDKRNSHSAVRRARKRGAKVGDLLEIKKIYLRAAQLRSFGFVVEVDHKTPLSKGGSHCASNLQIIPEFENARKHNNPNYEPIFIFQ